jgi:DNA-binding CsgD family transcriptional regulator
LTTSTAAGGVRLLERDAALAASSAAVVLGELATSGASKRLAVPPFSPEAVVHLAEPYGVDAGELHRSAGGNPFFVSEVLESGPGEIPPTIRDAILARASRLSPAARAVLGPAAVFPEHAEVWLLEAVAGESFGALDDCIAAGILVPDADGVAYRHELARAAIEESLSPHRRLELHRDAIAALLLQPGGSASSARAGSCAGRARRRSGTLRTWPRARSRCSLVADRLPNVEIARRLFLLRRTLDHHVSAILRKLGARRRSQASAEATRRGIV